LLYGGGAEQLIIQLKGILAVGVYTLIVSAVVWVIIKAVLGLRVTPEEEIEGLDHGEHGNEAYHGFVLAKSEG
jgi:Amt family ammonium transporter